MEEIPIPIDVNEIPHECAICNKNWKIAPVLLSYPFITDPDDPLYPYSGKFIHHHCYIHWKKKKEYRHRFEIWQKESSRREEIPLLFVFPADPYEGNPMVLFSAGMKVPCSLCGKNIIATYEREVISPMKFIDDEQDPLAKYCGTIMHTDCYKKWEQKEVFEGKFTSWQELDKKRKILNINGREKPVEEMTDCQLVIFEQKLMNEYQEFYTNGETIENYQQELVYSIISTLDFIRFRKFKNLIRDFLKREEMGTEANCCICGKTIDEYEYETFLKPYPFIRNQDNYLYPFCDKHMHKECYDNWELKEEFEKAFSQWQLESKENRLITIGGREKFNFELTEEEKLIRAKMYIRKACKMTGTEQPASDTEEYQELLHRVLENIMLEGDEEEEHPEILYNTIMGITSGLTQD